MDNPPPVCPLCGKPFVEGVRQRILRISAGLAVRKQEFVYQMPLIEIIAASLGCGALSKKASDLYIKIAGQVGTESNLWLQDGDVVLKGIPDAVVGGIKAVKENRFKIRYGFDGQYGQILLA